MSEVYPYALLTESPTTEARICWIDDGGSGGGSQSVEVDGDWHTDDDPSLVPDSDPDAYLYDVIVDGLDAATEYAIEIDSAETVEHTVRTLPESLFP
jgi:hypothetical protein